MMFGVKNPYLKTSDWGWQIDPTGLRWYLNEVYNPVSDSGHGC